MVLEAPNFKTPHRQWQNMATPMPLSSNPKKGSGLHSASCWGTALSSALRCFSQQPHAWVAGDYTKSRGSCESKMIPWCACLVSSLNHNISANQCTISWLLQRIVVGIWILTNNNCNNFWVYKENNSRYLIGRNQIGYIYQPKCTLYTSAVCIVVSECHPCGQPNRTSQSSVLPSNNSYINTIKYL